MMEYLPAGIYPAKMQNLEVEIDGAGNAVSIHYDLVVTDIDDNTHRIPVIERPPLQTIRESKLHGS